MENKFNNVHNKCIIHESKEHWISRSCAVVGVVTIYINEAEYVLIVKRGTGGDNVGKYCLPCGYIDWNENGHDAFIREVYEECDLDLHYYHNYDRHDIINNEVQPYYVSTNPKNNKENITLYFTSHLRGIGVLPPISNKNCEKDEIDEVLWMNLDDVDKYDFCFGHDEIIKTFC